MKIAVINTNDLKFNESELMHSNFTFDRIYDLLSDYITLREVNDENEMMQNIINEIVGEETHYQIHTAMVKYEYDDLYMMCHIMPSKETYEELKQKSVKYNGISSYLSDVGLKIYGQTVLFKLNTYNDANNLCSITMEKCVELFTNKFIHKGVILNTDGSMDNFKFIFNPVDWIQPNEIDKYKYHETEILGKVLMLFVDTTSTIENKTANKILQSIKGRVIIGMRDQYSDMNDTDVRYLDIDADIFKQVINVCTSSSKSLLDGEDATVVIDGKSKYNNFHKILKNRCLVQKQ